MPEAGGVGGDRAQPSRRRPLLSSVSLHTQFVKTDSHLRTAPQKLNDLLLSEFDHLPLG